MGSSLLVLLVGTGIYFTIRLNVLQVFKLPLALRYLFTKNNNDNTDCQGDIRFGALCTALAATIGTGNIVGVATAIKQVDQELFLDVDCRFFGMAANMENACWQ